jgi:hypothetical protein
MPRRENRRRLATLDKVVPTTALSSRQAPQDLGDQQRVSYRGTAAELREVLDHLASDEGSAENGRAGEGPERHQDEAKGNLHPEGPRGVGETDLALQQITEIRRFNSASGKLALRGWLDVSQPFSGRNWHLGKGVSAARAFKITKNW